MFPVKNVDNKPPFALYAPCTISVSLVYPILRGLIHLRKQEDAEDNRR